MYQVHIKDDGNDFLFAAPKNEVFRILAEAISLPERHVKVRCMKSGDVLCYLDTVGLHWPKTWRHEEINVLGLLSYYSEA